MIKTQLSSQLMERIAELHSLLPEMRLGQLVATIALLAEDETGHSLWDVEDQEFADAIERLAADLAARSSNSAS